MKLHTKTNTHESTHKSEITDFTIKASATAFDTLLSGLYSNKVKAVVRELWTNAYDSHVDAGIPDTPFDVHLPNRLEPTFRVRDYGVSLSHEDVVGLYTRVFDSTKNNSNDVVGALGLGSKSPFAYTDQFTVIARLDGSKRTYLAARQTDGTPGISLISDVKSDEAQGLEVSIAAEQTDFREFEREARSVAIGFSPAPDVDGAEIETIEPVWMSEDERFAIYKAADVGGRGIAIRQGCVIYPVDSYSHGRTAERVLQYGNTMVADVPIGAVSFVAGREAIEFNEQTTKVVENVQAEGIEVLKAEIDKLSSHCSTLLEAQEFWFGGVDNALVEAVSIKPTWKGNSVPNYVDFDTNNKNGQKTDHLIQVRQGTSRKHTYLRALNLRRRDDFRLVVIRDSEKVKRATLRYREFVELRGKDNVYITKNPTAKQLERYMRLAGLKPSQIVNVSTLPDPGPVERGNGGGREAGKMVGVKEIVLNSYGGGLAIEELPEDYIWFTMDRATKGNVQQKRWGLERSLKEGSIPAGVRMFSFTEKAVERYKPQLDKSQNKRYDALVEKNREVATKSEAAKIVRTRIARAGLTGVIDGIDSDGSYPEYVGYRVMTAADEMAAEHMEEAVKAYPLLFDSDDKAAIEWYVKARNSELEQST